MAELLTVLRYACPVDEVRERIVRLMKPRFANVEDLAKAAGVSATVLRYFLKGVTKELKFADAVRVSRVLEISPEELAFGERRLESKRRVSEQLSAGDGKQYPARADLVKLATTVQELVRETKRLGGRLQALEARGRSDRKRHRPDRPPA